MSVGEWIRFIVGAVVTLAGWFVFVTAVIGNLRFGCVLNRMQAAALGDTMGIFLCVLGIVILSGLNAMTLKLLLIVAFFWISSPVASHLLVKMEITTEEDLHPEKKVVDK